MAGLKPCLAVLAGLAVGAAIADASAGAANWELKPKFSDVYVDMSSVRKDKFQDPTCRIVACVSATVTYTVAWIWCNDPTGGKLEVIFDCDGKMGVMQQIIPNETKDSPYHTVDNTQAYKKSRVYLKGIAPDTFYDGAEKMVCKPAAH